MIQTVKGVNGSLYDELGRCINAGFFALFVAGQTLVNEYGNYFLNDGYGQYRYFMVKVSTDPYNPEQVIWAIGRTDGTWNSLISPSPSEASSYKIFTTRTSNGNIEEYNGSSMTMLVQYFPDRFASYETGAPIFDVTNEDGIRDYLTDGKWDGAINVKSDFTCVWTGKVDTTTQNPLLALSASCPQFSDESSELFGASSLAKMEIGFVYNETPTPEIMKSHTTYSYDTTIRTSYRDIVTLADAGIDESIWDKLIELLNLGTGYILFRLTVTIADVENASVKTLETPWGYIGLKYNSNVAYAFIEQASDGDEIIIVPYDTEDDNEDNPEDEDDSDYVDDGDVPEVSSLGLLTTTYAVTPEHLRELGQFLWNPSFIEGITMVNENPIENIVSCKLYPLSIVGGNPEQIVIGNVGTGVTGKKVTNTTFSQVVRSGKITCPQLYYNYLDYEPFTSVQLYLPFVGLVEIPTSLVIGKSVEVKWVFDLLTGSLQSNVYINDKCLYIYTSNIGIDMPLTASNRAQIEVGYIISSVNSIAQGMSGNIGGAMSELVGGIMQEYHSNTKGTPSPSTSVCSPLSPYLLVIRPTYTKAGTYNHDKGLPCHKSYVLGTLKGFTQCENPHIDSTNATDYEKAEIERLLTQGVII